MKYIRYISVALVLFGCVKKETDSGTLIPDNLRCEYELNPLGVERESPRLSWTVSSKSRAQIQSACRILVSSTRHFLDSDSGDLWDSGKIQSGVTIHVPYEGDELTARQRAWWKVMVWDAADRASRWSEPAYWEMGMLKPDDWRGEWIGYPDASTPFLRREFTVPGRIDEARAYICGMGYYELYINGERIGDHVLDPGQTDYEQRVLYVVYDVTEKLKEGQNTLGVILGNGWFNQTAVNHGKFGWTDCSYGKPRLLFQLHARTKEREEILIVSDTKWRANGGPITSNNVYGGERYDARKEMPGWSDTGFDDSAWNPVETMEPPGGKLVSQKIPPIKKIETILPLSVTEPEPGIFVYDMGQNFAGWARLKINAESGTMIQLRFAEEIFENGMIDPASTGVFALELVQTDTFICKGEGPEVWEPRFTYHGFRYVEMTGYPGTPARDNLEGVVVHTALEKAGEFECSDAMLNRIHETALWTERSNLHSIPTDCPAREKCGWLGDAHITAEMLIYNWDAALFWTKYVEDIETSRRGGVPDNIAPGRRHGGKAADWAAAFIQIPWYMCLYYGDTEPAREHYEGMKFLMDYFGEKSRDYILYDGLGDWCAPGSVRPVDTPVELTSTAFYYFDALIMKTFAGIFGREDDRKRFEELASGIRDAFIARFYDSREKTFGSQTADALALYLGLNPDGEKVAIAGSLNKNVMEKHDGHLAAGIFGSRHLYWALGLSGYGNAALTMLRKTDYPSIGYLLSIGATTLWECWDRDETGGAHGPRSHNHPMQGGFDAWFYNGIGGINPDPLKPGFKHIICKPQLYDQLDFARARYKSIYGEISGKWQRKAGEFTWDISIPANTTATVFLPAKDVKEITEGGKTLSQCDDIATKGKEGSFYLLEIGSGEYHFHVDSE